MTHECHSRRRRRFTPTQRLMNTPDAEIDMEQKQTFLTHPYFWCIIQKKQNKTVFTHRMF